MVQHWLRRGKRASAPPGPTHAVPPTAAFHKFNARPLGSSTFQGLNRTKWSITQESGWGGGVGWDNGFPKTFQLTWTQANGWRDGWMDRQTWRHEGAMYPRLYDLGNAVLSVE